MSPALDPHSLAGSFILGKGLDDPVARAVQGKDEKTQHSGKAGDNLNARAETSRVFNMETQLVLWRELKGLIYDKLLDLLARYIKEAEGERDVKIGYDLENFGLPGFHIFTKSKGFRLPLINRPHIDNQFQRYERFLFDPKLLEGNSVAKPARPIIE